MLVEVIAVGGAGGDLEVSRGGPVERAHVLGEAGAAGNGGHPVPAAGVEFELRGDLRGFFIGFEAAFFVVAAVLRVAMAGSGWR